MVIYLEKHILSTRIQNTQTLHDYFILTVGFNVVYLAKRVGHLEGEF